MATHGPSFKAFGEVSIYEYRQKNNADIVKAVRELPNAILLERDDETIVGMIAERYLPRVPVLDFDQRMKEAVAPSTLPGRQWSRGAPPTQLIK